jgi:hypothetical protein
LRNGLCAGICEVGAVLLDIFWSMGQCARLLAANLESRLDTLGKIGFRAVEWL